MAIVADVKNFLVAYDPRLWPMLIAVFVGLLYWVWRRIHPASFDGLNPRLKALPGALAAAILSGLGGPDVPGFILETILGALAAGGGHEFIQRLAGGSKSDRIAKKKPGGTA